MIIVKDMNFILVIFNLQVSWKLGYNILKALRYTVIKMQVLIISIQFTKAWQIL